jgi:uncharacterized membrane protein YbhN (UPF0104 family)
MISTPALRASGSAVLAAVVLALAAWLGWRQLHGLHPADIASALRATGAPRLLASVCFTALSFACLAQYERMATRWVVPGRVPRAEAWRTGLAAHALANTLGFHVLTAGAVRWRAYAPRGLSLAEVARIVAVVAACVGAGVVTLAVAALVAWQFDGDARGRWLAFGLVALACAWLLLRARAAQGGGDASASPARSHALLLAAIGLVEMGAAVAALYVLLPAGVAQPAPFALAFLGAMLFGLASHVPGGLGVFEAAMLAALAPAHVAGVLAALLAYRAIYNLLPFAITAVVLLLSHARARNPQPQFEAG